MKQGCTLGDLAERPLGYSTRTATTKQNFKNVISKVLFDPKCTTSIFDFLLVTIMTPKGRERKH